MFFLYSRINEPKISSPIPQKRATLFRDVQAFGTIKYLETAAVLAIDPDELEDMTDDIREA